MSKTSFIERSSNKNIITIRLPLQLKAPAATAVPADLLRGIIPESSHTPKLYGPAYIHPSLPEDTIPPTAQQRMFLRIF